MNEIVKLVQEKTGLSNEMAQTAVTTVLGFLKTKAPPQFASVLDSLTATESPVAASGTEAGIAEKAKAAVSSLFGTSKTA